LFFEVENAAELGFTPPENRLGDSLSTSVRSLSVMQKEAIVASSRTGKVWRLSSDEGAYLNGDDEAPCPLAFLTAGMVASYANEIVALAAQRGIAFRGLRLIQDNYYTMEGSMPKRTMVGGALPVELEVEIDCDADDKTVTELVYDAVAASPLNGLMRGALTSLFALSRNGAEVEPDRVAAIGRPIYPDPGDKFDLARPVPLAVEGELTWNGGETPRLEGDQHGGQGSSLQDAQKRQLHIGAICTLRPDGIKEITQLQYAPHGTNKIILSEEAPVNGGQGRAPDANTYISAGIGFCFMTQFGRFVAMMKKDLEEYRIVQDTHFSLGGASGGTGVAGTADPVETHVYLKTSEDEDFARDILDISEQTCFLHAFCRTDMKTKVRVTRMTQAA
jgi:uncharacterized OsmC-like protein